MPYLYLLYRYVYLIIKVNSVPFESISELTRNKKDFRPFLITSNEQCEHYTDMFIKCKHIMGILL
jgi:hypothetical protein